MNCLSTPVHQYMVNGQPVFVKREDLCAPPGAPPFSKMRGVLKHVQSRPESVIGVLDTFHSKAGWAVAYACREFGKTCLNYYPEYKKLQGVVQPQQERAQEHGAGLVKLPAGRSAILFHRAKKDLAQFSSDSYMMPNALKLPESVDENAEEAERTGQQFHGHGLGTLVISISSGTVASGVLVGLRRAGALPKDVILHMGYSRSHDEALHYILGPLSRVWGPGPWTPPAVHLVDEGYNYADKVDFPAPFPCNPYYDLKAWKWLNTTAVRGLARPILFWNIGD